MSEEISIRCEVAGCSWTTPKLSSQHYTAMVEQLKLHQNCRHEDLQEYSTVPSPLSLPSSKTHWEVFLASWRKCDARLQTVSSSERVATLLVWCGENVVSKLRNILGPHSLVKMEECQVLEEVRVLVEHWGPSLARFYLNTRVKKEEEETPEQFMSRLEKVSEYCGYTEKCTQCGVQVDFSAQIVQDHMLAVKDPGVYCKYSSKYRKEEHIKSSEVKDMKEGGVLMEQIEVKDGEEGIKEVSDWKMEGTNKVERNDDELSGYTCPDCYTSYRFTTITGLKRHRQIFCQKSKLNGEGLCCVLCKKTFKEEIYLTRHKKNAKGCHSNQFSKEMKITKKEEKEDIEKVSKEMEGTRTVELLDADLSGYTCPDCHKTRRYTTIDGLKRHRQIFCSKSKLNGEGIRCISCKKTFKEESYLRRHIRNAKGCPGSKFLKKIKIVKKVQNNCPEDEPTSSSCLSSESSLDVSSEECRKISSPVVLVNFETVEGIKRMKCKIDPESQMKSVMCGVSSKFGIGWENVRFECDGCEVDSQSLAGLYVGKEIMAAPRNY